MIYLYMGATPNIGSHFTGLSQFVEIDAEHVGGEPVFRGTRVTVKSLFDHLSQGDSLEVFLKDFPGVTRDQAVGALKAAEIGLLEQIWEGIYRVG